jgi:hypothetical protein
MIPPAVRAERLSLKAGKRRIRNGICLDARRNQPPRPRALNHQLQHVAAPFVNVSLGKDDLG